MQPLYDAVMALARSASDARNGGWLCGALGSHTGPKCVNGLVTWNMTWPRLYNDGLTFSPGVMSLYGGVHYLYGDDLPKEKHEAARIAGVALIKTRPPYDELIMRDLDDDGRSRMLELFAEPEMADDEFRGDTLALINDLATRDGEPLLSASDAAAWFDRACDLLAEQLPEPLPSALTVDEKIVVNRAPELTAV